MAMPLKVYPAIKFLEDKNLKLSVSILLMGPCLLEVHN